MKVAPSKSEHWQLRSMEGICYTDKKWLTACACQGFHSACFKLHLTLRCWVPVGSKREQGKVSAYRPAYKEPLWWPVAAGRGSATGPVQACHQQTMLPSPVPSLSTGRHTHTPSSAERSAQTTEPLHALRAGMRTSLGSATKINLKPLGERAARALEKVNTVPVQGTLKQIFTLHASSLLRLVLPYVFWHMQLCCSPLMGSRMPETSSAEPQWPCLRTGEGRCAPAFCSAKEFLS